MDTLSFNPITNLSEERKRRLVTTSFEAINSVFNTTDGNKNFSNSAPVRRYPDGTGEIFDNLFKVLELRTENDIELD